MKVIYWVLVVVTFGANVSQGGWWSKLSEVMIKSSNVSETSPKPEAVSFTPEIGPERSTVSEGIPETEGRIPHDIEHGDYKELEDLDFELEEIEDIFDQSTISAVCSASQFVCKSSGECLEMSQKCNGIADCSDGSDENECFQERITAHSGVTSKPCLPNQFHCQSGPCIEIEQKCDKRKDCDDLSDELGCGHKQFVNVVIYPKEAIELKENEGSDAVIRCRDEGPFRLPVKWTRSNRSSVRGLVQVTHGIARLHISNLTQNDGGLYSCLVEDSLRDAAEGKFVTNIYLRVQDSAAPLVTSAPVVTSAPAVTSTPVVISVPANFERQGHCLPTDFICKNGQCIDYRLRCNRAFDCEDLSDETRDCGFNHVNPSLSEYCRRRNNFKCLSGDCVDGFKRCDGSNDCFDNSDEADCPPRGSAPGSGEKLGFLAKPHMVANRAFGCEDKGPLQSMETGLRDRRVKGRLFYCPSLAGYNLVNAKDGLIYAFEQDKSKSKLSLKVAVP